MVIKKIHLVLGFAFIFAMAVTMVVVSTPAVAAPAETAVETDEVVETIPDEKPDEAGGFLEGNGNNLDLSKLQPGDLIITKGWPWYLVGNWGHTLVYVGNGWCVEAINSGVVWGKASNVLAYDAAGIFRVSTSSTIKNKAVNFAKAQLGKPYDWIWATYIGGKQVYGRSYYCSELAWAAYKAYGVDIDYKTGWNWKCGYSVAPYEIVYDSSTYCVAYSE